MHGNVLQDIEKWLQTVNNMITLSQGIFQLKNDCKAVFEACAVFKGVLSRSRSRHTLIDVQQFMI